jgi:tetratricopeptide (TPR) repeat protein
MGPMRLISPDGVDLTPKGGFRKAMLAVLALSPRQTKARKALLTMFWAESSGAKAGSSLRSALSTLRNELKPIGPDVIGSDSQSIWINPDMIWVDVLDGTPSEGEFLEGLDLGNTGAEGFEDWLRNERQKRRSAGAKPAAPKKKPSLSSDADIDLEKPLSVALVDPVISDIRVSAQAFSDSFMTMLGDGLQENCQAEVLDYRWYGSGALDLARSSGVTHLLHVAMHGVDDAIVITLKLSEAVRPKLLWQTTLSVSKDVLIDPLAPEAIEVAAFALDNLVPVLSSASADRATAFHLLSQFFQLDPTALSAARELIIDPNSQLPAKTRHALALYLQTLQIGERWSKDRIDMRNDMVAHTRNLLAEGPMGGLSLSLTGYAVHYLAQEDRLAFDMLTRATEIAPSLAMGWDHLALYHYHRGKLSRAREASGRALALSRHSPFRYAFETTRCMIAFAEGDHLTATHFGQMALSRMPGFSAALRYTAAALGFLNRHDEAEALKHTILERDPSFTASRVASGVFMSAGQEINDTIARGLARIGLD